VRHYSCFASLQFAVPSAHPCLWSACHCCCATAAALRSHAVHHAGLGPRGCSLHTLYAFARPAKGAAAAGCVAAIICSCACKAAAPSKCCTAAHRCCSGSVLQQGFRLAPQHALIHHRQDSGRFACWNPQGRTAMQTSRCSASLSAYQDSMTT
jgi:hypothetical protein